MDKWFETFKTSSNFSQLKQNPVAYFCAEYALSPQLPIYAGGLGVLAGDFLREARDQQFPIVAVGLYYSDGYQTLHPLNEKGLIDAPHVHTPPQNFGLEEVVDSEGKGIIVEVPIQDGVVKARCWIWKLGNVTVYLLDTNVAENSIDDKKITDHLYVFDPETRFKQAMILGIGGYRLLEALKIKPSIYHMNEGFSSLLCLELVKKYMTEKSVGFEEAKKHAAQQIVFTNHTLVIAGHDTYNAELLGINLSKYSQELGVPINEIIDAGAAEGSNAFSTSLFALRMSGKTNAVSKIHGKKALEIWPNNPMEAITNGIHIATWNSISDENDIWASHVENKRQLISKINLETGKAWDENTLIIGWARRLVSYKRPMALFENITRLKSILSDSARPVRIVVAGTVHPSDTEDRNEFLANMRKIMDEELNGLAVFLPGYDVALAKLMTAGCDIWLNTPIVGFEACGTSGMKAALNGDLPISTRDGWVAEIELLKIGWPLDTDKINESILNTLQNEVMPLYFNRDVNNIPNDWINNMKNARQLIKSEFSTTRMLKEYIEKLYLPLLPR